LIDPELLFFFHNGLPVNARCPLADAGSLEDNERMVYALKIEIELAWWTIKRDKGISADDKRLGIGYSLAICRWIVLNWSGDILVIPQTSERFVELCGFCWDG